MTIGSRRASLLLFLGDFVAFACSLWLTLLLRYGDIPTDSTLDPYLAPFALLFVAWFLVFFSGGLYEKRVLFFKRDLSGRIVRTQIVNIVIAALFFFVVPAFGIAPKTNLAIYLVVSLALILIWRIVIFPRLAERRSAVDAVIVGSKRPEEEELRAALANERYGIRIIAAVNPAETGVGGFRAALDAAGDAKLLIVDTRDEATSPLVPEIYRRAFEKDAYQIVDMLALYEEVFDRVPLSLLEYEWFFRYATRRASGAYLFAKRALDILGALVMGAVTVAATPFIWAAMRIEGPGPLFIRQDRIGEFETRVRSYKFRSMRYSDGGAWRGESENYVTRVGAFLRKTSLDEFPQFVNILSGELSLIGPRNDIEGLGKRLAEALPYYRVRYIVKPGITGWAQVNQRYEPGNLSPQSIEETKLRLAYDFYYVKHRSFMLDVVIALKTIKRMFFRLGDL